MCNCNPVTIKKSITFFDSANCLFGPEKPLSIFRLEQKEKIYNGLPTSGLETVISQRILIAKLSFLLEKN